MAAPKLVDVARLAGVSTATVSRALNQPDTVTESTRLAVMEAASQTGYRINVSAQNLRKGRSRAIVVLVPNLGNPFFSEILSGIETTLAKLELSVLVVDSQHPDVPANLVFEYLHSGRADGIISLDGTLSDKLLSGLQGSRLLPPMIYACEWNEAATSPTVCVDNKKGAREAIAHLAELGHQKIGHIKGPADNVLTKERQNGTIAEMEARGLKIVSDWFFDGDFTVESGERAAQLWLELQERPTAMFCASDEMAIGFISALHKAGVYVPKDVSVVGFDDIETARYFIPSLTTIRQPRNELGAAAAQLLVQLLQNNDQAAISEQTMLDVELIPRGSTGLLYSFQQN